MTAQVWEAQVRDRAAFLHMIGITDHCIRRMNERGITRRHIQRVLQNGTIAKGPEWDGEHASWVGSMRGVAAGMELVAVCAIEGGVMTVTVVTTYPVGK